MRGPIEVGVGPGTQELEIRVGEGVSLRGRLDGFADLVAPRVHLEFAGEAAVAEVTADGRFEFHRLGPGRRTLYLAGGDPGAVIRNWYFELGDAAPEELVLRARDGEASLSISVRGLAEGHARIAPLGTARVPLSVAQHHRRFVNSAFRIDGLAPGRYRVRITGDGRSADAEVDVDGDATLTVDVAR